MVTPQNASSGRATNRPPQMDTESVTQQAGSAAQDLKEQAQQTAGTAVDQVKETASNQLGSQKDRAATSLNSLADTLHQAGHQLESSDQAGFFAKYAHQAADRISQVANHLDQREIDELVAEVEQYARKQPAVFLGGAFMLGVLGARFLKSSSQRRSDDFGSYRNDSGSRLNDAYRGNDRASMYAADRSYGSGYRSGSSYDAGAAYRSGYDATQAQTTSMPRVDDAERLDALRRGDVPHQAAAPGATGTGYGTAGTGTTGTGYGTGVEPPTGGQSARPGLGDTARNTEIR